MNHFHLFGHGDFDTAYFVDNYMPLLMDYNFDFFLNGHEHIMTYYNYLYADYDIIHEKVQDFLETRVK